MLFQYTSHHDYTTTFTHFFVFPWHVIRLLLYTTILAATAQDSNYIAVEEADHHMQTVDREPLLFSNSSNMYIIYVVTASYIYVLL